ncbi:MIP family channel protein [Nocardioides sp. dk4132]|uniref:MIP/aquaporin family protein n=1 Tax=unclassified Nocardioides TaxID=2615069 RepID=UPI001294A99C|nr:MULTISPECIES: MIP family channel protein [unclassified Nocardioides]MQW75950.1 MIP family channel protein [Nocardioides sp. dk4132]QGA08809.1 MIP family channel protein [Nocardioides sp. dk884]
MTDTSATPAPQPDADLANAEPSSVQKLIAETIGTFILVFFGCGAAVMSGGDYVGTALAFGLALLVGIYAFGRISGAHYNPAVSLGAALSGRVAWAQLPLYIGGQLVGAILAGLALFVLMHGFEGYDATGNMGQNFFGDDTSGYAVWAALLLEMLLTAIFVMVILAVTDARFEHPALAPLTIGIALVGIHLVAIPATGTSVNPARSIGPALFAGGDAILQLWLFILAPLLGAVIAGLLYPLAFGRDTDPVPGSGLSFAQARAAGYGGSDSYQQQWNQPEQGATGEGAQPGQAGAVGTSAGGQGAQAGQAGQQYSSEPIIQDGWQWDPHAQQWIPAQQPTAQPGQGAAGSMGSAGQPGVAGPNVTGPNVTGPNVAGPGATGAERDPAEEWPEDGGSHIRPGQ